MTLVEVVVALGLVALLATFSLPLFQGWRDQGKVKKAQDDIIAASAVIDTFLLDNNRLPTSLAAVGRGNLREPWCRACQYTYLMDGNGNGKARKDHSLVPLNTDYDLYSKGRDGSSAGPLTAKASRDDILRANNGRFVGPADRY